MDLGTMKERLEAGGHYTDLQQVGVCVGGEGALCVMCYHFFHVWW
jgi:hypothetical protein